MLITTTEIPGMEERKDFDRKVIGSISLCTTIFLSAKPGLRS